MNIIKPSHRVWKTEGQIESCVVNHTALAEHPPLRDPKVQYHSEGLEVLWGEA